MNIEKLDRISANIEKVKLLSNMYEEVKHSGNEENTLRLQIIRKEMLEILNKNKETIKGL